VCKGGERSVEAGREARFRKSMAELLLELFEKSGSRPAVAEVISVNPNTLDDWVRVLGLLVRRTSRLVPVGERSSTTGMPCTVSRAISTDCFPGAGQTPAS